MSLFGSVRTEPKRLLAAGLVVTGAFAGLLGTVQTAAAHDRDWDRRHYRHGPPPRVYYAPPPRYYYAPPPRVYYAPPPPVYYAPAPAYVEPSINFVFPIRIK